MNNKTLLIVFLGLLALYGLNRLFSGKRDSNFNSELIKVDTATVTSIVVSLHEPEPQEISLKKEEGGWIVSNGHQSAKAMPEAITSVLTNLSLVRTQQIAASSADLWSAYEVGEGQGVGVKVYKGSQLKEDFIVGKFDFNPETRSGKCYVRLNGQNEVYSIDGFELLSFKQGFEAYRNRELIKMKAAMKVNEFLCQWPDTTSLFKKTPLGWTTGNATLDSMKVENYLNVLRNLTATTFADDFDETKAGRLHFATLTIKGDNIEAPYVIDCYRDTTREHPFVLHSTYNPETWFESDSAGVFKQIFLDLKNLTAGH